MASATGRARRACARSRTRAREEDADVVRVLSSGFAFRRADPGHARACAIACHELRPVWSLAHLARLCPCGPAGGVWGAAETFRRLSGDRAVRPAVRASVVHARARSRARGLNNLRDRRRL